MQQGPIRRAALRRVFAGLIAVSLSAFGALVPMASGVAAAGAGIRPKAVGMLDCNGFSPIQRTLKVTGACSDPKGYEGGRFYDNGHYIGHDEPIARFLSHDPGSGNDVLWNETLPRDPAHRPTVSKPGSDITHWFELSVAPWFSMALCNPRSYPLAQCTPKSDTNASHSTNPGGGSSFLEVQFYPPGYGPFVDNISCDNTHWCASLHINDLECTAFFGSCNPDCIEPTNFAFIQTDGVPTGPPGPQLANLATFTPNSHTLQMNPGDRLSVHIWDAGIGGGQHALEVRVDDHTTGQSGYMIASAKNGYMATSYKDCSGHPWNYRPEYDTAGAQESIPWAALETNISTQFEIGHFIPCSQVRHSGTFQFGSFSDTFWKQCRGPYESTTSNENGEVNDAPCYKEGDTHGGTSPPNLVTGCDMFFFQNGDLDFDGTPYWRDWPDKTSAGPFPSPFLQENAVTKGRQYDHIQFQTDVAASESTCGPWPNQNGCRVPPPGAPGKFYPYWTFAKVAGACVWEFGRMSNGNDFGKLNQYGVSSAWYFGNLEGPIQQLPTSC
jgi:hypothetical protein